MNLGKAYKKVREFRGLSVEELSNSSGVIPVIIEELEKNTTIPPKDIQELLRNSLGIPKYMLQFLALEESDVSDDKKAMYHHLNPMVEKFIFCIVSDEKDQ